ncbi:MAG TPA: dehydrogenase E1 component subunit alpha/beta [Acidimicrobiia bacterium]|nr:dehydrogenase E1 component subunit alpha/beta [Acidimicrobiia bacterium]
MIEAKGHAAELTEAELVQMYEMMVLGRTLETRLHNMYRGGRLTGAVYPGVGQEAAQVGFAFALEEGDIFGPTHRDLLGQLTRGVTLEETLLNFYGKASAPTKGRDGNSHFGVLDKGTLMVISPLPDAYPVAMGCALAFDQRKERRVAMANCGEGATATGTWHEAVNMAAVLHLPIVFTVQNNQYAYSTPNEREFKLSYVAHRADGYGIPGVVVDGNDILDCYSAAKEAVERARNGEGPTLIEAVTFRHFGHAGHDPADYVKPDEREEWMAKDPLPRFEEFLVSRGILDEAGKAEIHERAENEVRATIEWAQEQPDPAPSDVPVDLFAPRSNPAPAPGEATGEPVTLLDAVTQTLEEEMERDERVFIIGEDVGPFGGAFKVTKGLFEKYGPHRVIDSPIAESAIVGGAVGAALMGQVPIVELQYTDFIYPAMDQIANEAAKYLWKAGKPVPMVIRGPSGAGLRAGPFHSISPEGMLSHHPGIKVVVPSTPIAAKGLLRAAIRDPNPVVFLEHKKLYRSIKEPLPPGDWEIELGRARLAREGDDVTIVTWGAMVHASLEAAERLSGEGVEVEILDLQTVSPVDWDAVFSSVAKTSRLVVVQEDVPFASVASEVAARVAADAFWDLDTPIVRVTPPHTHIPFAAVLEDAFVPQPDDVYEAVRKLADA